MPVLRKRKEKQQMPLIKKQRKHLHEDKKINEMILSNSEDKNINEMLPSNSEPSIKLEYEFDTLIGEEADLKIKESLEDIKLEIFDEELNVGFESPSKIDHPHSGNEEIISCARKKKNKSSGLNKSEAVLKIIDKQEEALKLIHTALIKFESVTKDLQEMVQWDIQQAEGGELASSVIEDQFMEENNYSNNMENHFSMVTDDLSSDDEKVPLVASLSEIVTDPLTDEEGKPVEIMKDYCSEENESLTVSRDFKSNCNKDVESSTISSSEIRKISNLSTPKSVKLKTNCASQHKISSNLPVVVLDDIMNKKLPSVLSTLKTEEKIGMEPLENISPAIAAELVPKPMGLPVKFLSSLEKYKYDKTEIQDMLQWTPKGKKLMKFYSIHKYFENSHRDDLVDIIINFCIENKYFIDRNADEILQHYSESIIEEFPNEDKYTYFTPPLTNGKYQRRANGKLIARYRDIRRRLRRAGLIGYVKSLEAVSSSYRNIFSGNNLSKEEFFDVQQWLKYNREPWDEVERLWRQTSKGRLASLYLEDDEQPIGQVLKNWPILEDSRGYALIDIDFEFMFKSKSKFYFNWNFNKTSLKYLMLEKIRNKDCIHYLKSVSDDSPGEDSVLDSVLLHFLPLKFRTRYFTAGKNAWKVSKADMQESFVMHVKSADEIKNVLTKKQEKMKLFNLTVQPFVILEGEDILHIVSSYVVINHVLYQFDTPLKALEYCFKSFHALNTKYPPEVENVWLFIQKFLFEIKTPNDQRTSPEIRNLISEILYNDTDISDSYL